MSDKRRGKQRKFEEGKPTKEEYAVAKYLRFGLPPREGKLHGMEVKCFIASVAIHKLLESKWSASKNKKDPLFTNRASCILYLDTLLRKGLFHRADRERKKKDKDVGKRKKKEKEKQKEDPAAGEDGVKQRKSKKKKEKEEEGIAEKNAEDTDKDQPEKKTEKKEEKKKKEKRLKLLMSENQWFEDGEEVYVWIYDPVNAKTFFIGLLMVFGAVGLCMFPLWPEEVRIGVYYLSLCAAGFVGFILFLAVVRLVLFCVVWVLTFGRHHFWFLPNLTEDVGFFDSFRPLYKHDIMSGKEEADSGKKKKKKPEESKEDEVSFAATADTKDKSSDKDDSDEFEVIKKEDLDEGRQPTGEEDKEGAGKEMEERNDDLQREEGEEMENNEMEEDTENGDEYSEDDENSEEKEHTRGKKKFSNM